MIREIQTYKHSSTDTYYATCHSSKYGVCTQWGKNDIECIEKLREFVTRHWGEKWPEVYRGDQYEKYIKMPGWDVIESINDPDLYIMTNGKEFIVTDMVTAVFHNCPTIQSARECLIELWMETKTIG